MSDGQHIPVLAEPIINWTPSGAERIVDATVGAGGHAAHLLEAFPQAHLLGLDRDKSMLAKAEKKLYPFHTRVHLVHANFSQLQGVLNKISWDWVDYIVADLGISSLHLEDPQRGFSFSRDGPLDMRLDSQGPTAEAILNTYSREALSDLFARYGEEKMADKLAKAIVAQRQKEPFKTTLQLKRFIHQVKGRAREGKLDSATRVFQALRIAVNQELDHLSTFIPQSVHVVRSGGRVAIISFHSLEDRIVKTLFRHFSGKCICPPGTLHCTCSPQKWARIITKKPLKPSQEEIQANPRARSARLRILEKL